MTRKLVTAVLAVVALIAGEQITAPLDPKHPARVSGHTIDHCRKVMALYDQSKDLQRAKEFCRPLLR